MYNNLNDACKSGDQQLAGYITLLQVIMVNDCYLIVFNMFIWNLFSSDQICVVLDLWVFSIYCWHFYGPRLWWKVTMGLPLDFYEVITSIDISKVSRSTDDCWGLLDALRWPPCSSTSFHVFLDISDGVLLSWYTDQRGWCKNLGMLRPFLHTLWDQDYRSKILTTDWCISLSTLHQWGRFVLCLDNVHRTTSTGSTWFCIHSWHRPSPGIRPNIHLHARWDICGTIYAWVPSGSIIYGGSTYTCTFWCGAA